MSIVFVDGKNQLYRNYHVGKFLTREDGHPTGALYGCLNHSLLAIARRLPDASFVWVWDGVGETWRHRMMAQLPQIDLKEPEEEDASDNDSGQYTQHTQHMARSSLEFLGLYKLPTKKKTPRKVGYKANRIQGSSKEHVPTKEKVKSKWPEDDRARALIQMPILRLILEGAGFRQFEVQGLECDDLLAMLVMKAREMDPEEELFIMSGDKDYYQLLQYDSIKIITGLNEGKIKYCTGDDVEQGYGITPENWTRFRALTGDSSDNIPHLSGVGKRTALKMLEAGFNPSDASYRHIPVEAQEKFIRIFNPHGIKTLWPAVYGNWKLCEFVTDITSDLLSEDVREKLRHMFAEITSINKFKRRKSKLNEEHFRRVSFLMAQYELHSILAQRDLFWQVP